MPRHIALAVLYVLVVLLVAMTGSRRTTLVTASICVALTLLAPALSHLSCLNGDAGVHRALSVIAIAATTLIALRHQTSTARLIEQIHLLNLTHDAIVVYDMKDRIAFWNHGAESLYGWPAHRALRQSIHELTQTRFPAAPEEVRKVLLQVGRWDGELERTRYDGKVITIACRLALLRDERGEPRAVLSTDNDITCRKDLQAQLQRKQDEMSAMLEAIPGMIWASTHDGDVEPVNRRWDAFDIAPGNGAQNGRSLWRTLVHPHDLPGLENDWRAAVAAGSAFESTARLRRKDGLYRWMHMCAEPLRDTAGQIVRWYGINTDIEERKCADEKLERSEAFLAEGQRLSRTGSIAMKLPDGEMLWSQEAYRIFGYAANVVPSMDLILARTHPEDVALVRQSYRQVLAETPSIDIEHRLVMPDRSIKHVHYVAHLSARQSGRFEYVGALMDVTEAKQTEEALTRSMAELAHVTRVTMLGELTASIAHEVSQPIAAVVTCGHAALRWLDRPQPDLAEAREAIDKAIRSAKRASDIVWRIRSMAQKRDPTHAELDLNALVDESIELVLHELHDHQVELDIDFVWPPPRINGDRVQLQQVLINLIMNGAQAMVSATGRAKRMWVATRMIDAQHAHVIVKDSGIGISAAHAERLFEAFFTTKSEGMGIGLSICRSIVEAHGGQIWAESPPEGGAVLQFTLPVCDGRQQ
ncbi:PAS domain-containing sensor histidine kinase [Paraburkholderia rhizosphaerae]|nr:PAS domain-containing sensor histidine kinase [Paraburkholderia rhizosphaerae]